MYGLSGRKETEETLTKRFERKILDLTDEGYQTWYDYDTKNIFYASNFRHKENKDTGEYEERPPIIGVYYTDLDSTYYCNYEAMQEHYSQIQNCPYLPVIDRIINAKKSFGIDMDEFLQVHFHNDIIYVSGIYHMEGQFIDFNSNSYR